MRDYLESITPDSFSGMVFALEGITGGVTLINGPTGCKFYHASTSDNQLIRQFEFDPLNYPEEWYFGQPRVPCTYLDRRDYVYGSREKLEEAMEFLSKNVSLDFLGIVNSPGAALIGDDLEGIAAAALPEVPRVVIQTPGFSETVCGGYEKAISELICQAGPAEKTSADPAVVNLLGISIYQRNYEGDRKELTRLLELCGIRVGCALGAGCSFGEFRELPRAALNIVVRPEYGTRTAELLEQKYGTPYYVCDGPPIGFSATEQLIENICGLLKRDSSAFLEESERTRARAYVHISRLNSLTGLPKGVPFAVEGNWSELCAYTRFLVKYFGMLLESAAPTNPEIDGFQPRFEDLLRKLRREKALREDLAETEAELVFGSGNTIARLKLRGREFSGIEISLPTIGYTDVIPKTHLGLSGALLLTEQIINGIMF